MRSETFSARTGGLSWSRDGGGPPERGGSGNQRRGLRAASSAANAHTPAACCVLVAASPLAALQFRFLPTADIPSPPPRPPKTGTQFTGLSRKLHRGHFRFELWPCCWKVVLPRPSSFIRRREHRRTGLGIPGSQNPTIPNCTSCSPNRLVRRRPGAGLPIADGDQTTVGGRSMGRRTRRRVADGFLECLEAWVRFGVPVILQSLPSSSCAAACNQRDPLRSVILCAPGIDELLPWLAGGTGHNSEW
ncbi:hypothetical protein QBC34DRAFT_407544 [Podospora aff. communis PSN243]|uniref:Uncharacterized protein n=1 Tax=Podospora aff. communis PSN243 TaxID=3040156 RepID=A0AAV9GL71_9PEZI|nr:hypothetical protein QBC34DRAFT_407544 [Podospora aff. communis PSN243]